MLGVCAPSPYSVLENQKPLLVNQKFHVVAAKSFESFSVTFVSRVAAEIKSSFVVVERQARIIWPWRVCVFTFKC